MSKSDSPNQSSGIDWRKIAVIAILLVIAGYRYYVNQQNPQAADGPQPGVNENVVTVPETLDLDLDLGSATEKSPQAKLRKSQPSLKKTQPFLKDGKNGSKVSPEGLVYTSTRHGEHRTTHVLRHAKDIPNRQGSHGVFDVSKDDQVFELIDEAYALIQSKSKQVKAEPEQDGKRAYVIDMKRTIGYKGGQSGKRAGYPKLRKIKLILADNRVITAYPY